MMDKKHENLPEVLAWILMAVFLVIVIINAITHNLDQELVECAIAWLIIGTPALILTHLW